MWYYFYMNKDVIYIEPEDDITDIITKIEGSKEKIVALVPPKKAVCTMPNFCSNESSSNFNSFISIISLLLGFFLIIN